MTFMFSRSLVSAAMLIGLAPAIMGQAAAGNNAPPRVESPTSSADEVDRAIAAEITERFKGDRANFLSFLREQGKTVREYRQEMGTRLSQSSAARPSVAESNEQRVHLRLIQLNRRAAETDEELLTRGKEVLAKLNAGEAFAEVARKHSDDLKRARGGDWGWLKRSDFKVDFEQVAFALKAGEVSQPIVKPEGWFILFVEDRR
jgi:peptidyl-prolyl cis-trans isomerase SurA